MELIFNLFSFDATVNYRGANCREKSAWGGLDLRVIQSPTAVLCFRQLFLIFVLIIRTLLSNLRFLITTVKDIEQKNSLFFYWGSSLELVWEIVNRSGKFYIFRGIS